MKSNITFRSLTDKYSTYSEQDHSHILYLYQPFPPLRRMHKAQGGDSSSFSKKLQDAWLCTESMELFLRYSTYGWMQDIKGAESGGLETKCPIWSRNKAR